MSGRDVQPLSAERLADIREHVAGIRNWSLGNLAARDLLAEVDRLLAERHETNESLSLAAEALRENRDRFETLRSLCDAADHVGIVSGGWFTVEAVRRAAAGEPLPKPDGITRLTVPTQALRERPGEFEATLHHGYAKGRDLPQTGGQR